MLAGQYRIGRRIGSGAYSSVHSAIHVPTNIRVAAKIPLNPNAEVLARFQREVDIHSHLKHQNIVRLYDSGFVREGVPFLIMEYIEGANLEQIVQNRKALDGRFVLRIAQEVAAGLGAIHNHGFIHRDLKPSNIFVGRSVNSKRVTVKLIDFGLSKGVLGQVSAGVEPITELGRVCGTPAYMAPEQILGQDIGPQCDIYALGAIMWECLTGAAPYPSPDPIKVMIAHVEQALPDFDEQLPSGDACPDELRAVVLRSLQKHPQDRYPNSSVLFHTLRQIRQKLKQTRYMARPVA